MKQPKKDRTLFVAAILLLLACVCAVVLFGFGVIADASGEPASGPAHLSVFT